MKFLSDPEGRRLFDQLCARPELKSHRAVLSDWLLERGDPLGEFIAVQLKRAGSKREIELRRAHESDWLGPIHTITAGQSLVFKGGFLDSLSLESNDWRGPNAAFMKALKATTGHPALSLVTSVALGRNLEHGASDSPARGAKIPIVAFFADRVFDRLKSIEVDADFSPPVFEGLQYLRPTVKLKRRGFRLR